MAEPRIDDDPLHVPPPVEDDGEPSDDGHDHADLVGADDGDPFDDTAGASSDDGFELDEVEDAGVGPDDAAPGADDALDTAVDVTFASVALGGDLEEPGIALDGLDVDAGAHVDLAGDRGEEGPSEGDAELRVEDLPSLDADEDGDMSEAVLFDTTALVAARESEVAWADDAWTVSRIVDGAFRLVGGEGETVVALGSTGLAEVSFAPSGRPVVKRRPSAGDATSIASAPGEGGARIVLGGAEPRIVEHDGRVLPIELGPARIVGTSRGVLALGRRGALFVLKGQMWVPVEAERVSRRHLPPDEGRVWVHAAGAGPAGEACLVTLDEGSGGPLLEAGARPPRALDGLPDDAPPTDVQASGELVLVACGATYLVSFEGEPLAPLAPRGSLLAAVVVAPQGPEAPFVMTAHVEEDELVLVRRAGGVAPRIVAAIELHGAPSVDVEVALHARGASVVVAAPSGLYDVRPPRRSGRVT